MKISVIIPAYNEELVLRDTLKAILAQDYPDFEVIVVDNNSTDKTADVARDFPVKVISESRKGTMWACEAGRKVATGEIVVRMDADCLPDTDWLSRGVRFFKNSEVVIVSGPYDYYDASGFFRLTSRIIQNNLYVLVHYLLHIVNNSGISIGGNTFLRASALERIGGFNTNFVFYGDDTDLPKRISTVGRAVFSPRLVMKTSARRYAREGIFKLTLKYWYYFFKTIFSSRV